jgi:hypothetical protein
MKHRTSLPWVAVAVLALALPITPAVHAATGKSDSKLVKMISADLPPGVTLKTATAAQMADAIYTVTSERPDLALGVLQAAIISKRPPPHQGDIPCPDVIQMLKKSVAAAPDKARDLLELAISLNPECTDSFNELLSNPALLGLSPGAFGAGLGNSGFGAGLGSNFPGAPGFTGSPPGGATALPPSGLPATTSVVNG